jgi:hypothetical protein
MLIFSIIFFIVSNSLSNKRDISIYYSRIGIIILFSSILICYNNIYTQYSETILGLNQIIIKRLLAYLNLLKKKVKFIKW